MSEDDKWKKINAEKQKHYALNQAHDFAFQELLKYSDDNRKVKLLDFQLRTKQFYKVILEDHLRLDK